MKDEIEIAKAKESEIDSQFVSEILYTKSYKLQTPPPSICTTESNIQQNSYGKFLISLPNNHSVQQHNLSEL